MSNIVLKWKSQLPATWKSVENINRALHTAIIENELITLNLEPSDFIERVDILEELWRHVGSDPDSSIEWKGRNISYREFFSMTGVSRCARENSCNDSDGREGWGCALLRSVHRYFPSYQRREFVNCWYLYGSFTEENVWDVDRLSIFEELVKEAGEKYLDLCPSFSIRKVRKIVESLPGRLSVGDKTQWEIVYRENFETAERKPDRITPRYWSENGEEILPVAPKPSESSVEDNPGGEPTPLLSIHKMRKEIRDHSKHATGETVEQTGNERVRNIPQTGFDQIGGVSPIIKMIREVVELPIIRPNLFRYFNIKPHKGILLYGPPGCGKTMIARAIACEVEAHFIAVNGPELLSKWHGQSEQNLRDIFKEARELSPSIIFFDEIDSITPARSENPGSGFESRVVNQLLTLMDGVEDYSQVSVIAATNRMDILDPAILRPGRFDYSLHIPFPDHEGVKEILNIATGGMPLVDCIDMEKLTEKMIGFSGADIAYVCREAAYNTMRRTLDWDTVLSDDDQQSYNYTISMNDFGQAIDELNKRRPNNEFEK